MMATSIDTDAWTGPVLTLDEIITIVCDRFGLHRDQVISADRHKTVALARHLVVYFARRTTDLSYPEIGRALGRDHTSIMSANAKIRASMSEGLLLLNHHGHERIRVHVRELEQELLAFAGAP